MKERNIRLLYWHEALFQFSDSMLIIVLPVFLLKVLGSVSAVFAWSLIWNSLYALIFIPLFNWGMRWGRPKYMMLIGMLFYIGALMLFGQIDAGNTQLLPLATVLFTIYIASYWMTRHWFVAVNADYKRVGEQISNLWVIRILIAFIAPIIGGLVSFLVSFNSAFILGMVAIFLSMIPIILFHAPPHPEHFGLDRIKKMIRKPALVAIKPAYFAEGFSFQMLHLGWVLAFAIFIGNIKDLGFLVGISALVAGVLSKLTGRRFDRRKRTKTLNQAVSLKTLSTLLLASIFFYPKLAYVYLVNTFDRFAHTILYTTTDSYLYGYGNKIHPVEFSLYREIYLTTGRVIGNFLLMVTFYFLSDQYLWLVIGLGAFTVLGWLSLKKSDHLLH